MTFRKKMASLTLLSLSCVSLTHATDGTWVDSSGTWNTSGNWSGGIPQNAGDTATFGPNATNTISVDIPVTLKSLTFNNGSYTLTPSLPADVIHFDTTGPSGGQTSISVSQGQHTINTLIEFPSSSPVNISISNPSASLTIAALVGNVTPPSFLTLSGPGELTLKNNTLQTTGLQISNGNLELLNTLAVSTIGAEISSGSPVTATNSTINALNQGFVSSSGSGCAFNISGDLTLNASSFILNNTNTVSGTGTGIHATITNNLTLNGGAIEVLNNGEIDIGAPINGSIGSAIFSSQDFMLNSGNVSLNNGGTINGSSNSGCIIDVNNFIMNGGTFTNTNTGEVNVNNGTASALVTNANVIINNGTMLITNSGTINSNVGATVIQCLNTFTMNGGNLTFINQGTIVGGGAGAGFVVSSDFVMNGGSILLQNYGNVVQGSGAVMFSQGNIILNQGVITNKNFNTGNANNAGSTIFANSIAINGGTIINDSVVGTATLLINQQGTYAGVGISLNPNSSSGIQVTNSGTLIPGDPGPGGFPGTMTILGSYTQTPSGVFVTNFFNDTTFSQLNVMGPAQITGSIEVAVTPGFTITPGVNFPVLIGQTVTGEFTNLINFNLPPTLMPNVQYFPNQVVVYFTPGAGKYVKLNQPIFSSINQTNIRLESQMGRMRDHFTKDKVEKPSSRKMAARTDNEDLPIQLAWHPIPWKSLEKSVEIEKLPNIEEQIAVRVEEEKTQRLTESLATPQERPWNLYVGPKGQIGNVVSKADTQGYQEWSAGFFTGFDYVFSQVGLGFLFEYERVTSHVGKEWGTFTIDNVHASVYSTYAPKQLPEFSIQGIVGGGYDGYSIKRTIGNANQDVAKGTPKAGEFDAFLGVEYAFRESGFSVMPKGLQIIPLASVQYIYLGIDDYKERGADLFNIKVGSQHPKSFRSNLGFRLSQTWDWKDVSFSPEIMASWQREYLDKERSVGFTPVSFQSFGFSLEIPKTGRNIALIGADFLVTLYGRHGLEAGYNFEYNSLYHTHFAYISYNVRF
jgi:uncharacterized protein YhjY with autotransporter beta-barrel domain